MSMPFHARILAPVLLTAALAPAAGAKVFTFSGSGAIPDGIGFTGGEYGPPRTLTATSNLADPIQRVNLLITMNHSWIGDLKIDLKYTPSDGSGTTYIAPVIERIGATTLDVGGDDSNFNGTYTFTIDAADIVAVATPLGDSGVIPSGMYTAFAFTSLTNPNTPIKLDAVFRGRAGTGAWQLEFRDGTTFDTGTVSAASINIEAGPIACLADFDGNGVVNTSDLIFFLGRFTQTCP